MEKLRLFGTSFGRPSSPPSVNQLLIPSIHQGENVGPNSPNGVDAAKFRTGPKNGFSKPTSPRNALSPSPLRPAVGAICAPRASTASATPVRLPRDANRTPRSSQKRKVSALLEQPQGNARNSTSSGTSTAPLTHQTLEAHGYSALPLKRNCLEPNSTQRVQSSPLEHIAAVAQQRSRSSSESSTDPVSSAQHRRRSEALTPQQPISFGLVQPSTLHLLQPRQLGLFYGPSQAGSLGQGVAPPQASVQWPAMDLQPGPQTPAPAKRATKKCASNAKKGDSYFAVSTSATSTASSSSSSSTATDGVRGVDGADASIPKKCGRWTDEEHKIFVRGLRKHGKNWSVISQMVRTRTTVQVRTHAQKYFIKQQRAGLDPMEGVGRGAEDPNAVLPQPGAGVAAQSRSKSTSDPEKRPRKQAQRRPRSGPSGCTTHGRQTGPRSVDQELHAQHPFRPAPAATVRPARPPTVLTSMPLGHQYRPRPFLSTGQPPRPPSILLNRPHSPASTRTIQTAAAHLLNLHDLGSRRNSGRCAAVY